MLEIAKKIEGMARNIGTHAAAVVIADKPLTEYVPLSRVSGNGCHYPVVDGRCGGCGAAKDGFFGPP